MAEFKPRQVSEMELAGMGKSDRDLLLGYLGLIPANHRPDVLKDRRSYANADGTMSVPRCVETWREAHRVLVKLEEADSSSKALIATVGSPGSDAGDGRRRRERTRKDTGGAPDAAVVNADGEVVRVCFNMRDWKSCDRGADCRFSHDATAVQEARKEEAARLRAEGGGGGGKVGKGDKNGKGKGGGKGLGKAGGGKPTDGGGKGKKGICLQYLRGSCSRAAKDCAFLHDVKQAQRVVDAVYAGAGGAVAVPRGPKKLNLIFGANTGKKA